ncbi:MAG: hypothetical protein ACRDD4_07665 [Culicoidibacterales bacterium]
MRKKLVILILVITTIGIGIIISRNQTRFAPTINETARLNLVQFFRETMIETDGGIKTTYLDYPYSEQAELTIGHATLSESQGLLLEYAIRAEDRPLFLQTLAFILRELKLPTGNFAWRISADRSERPTFTATIDDLQIIEQIVLAKTKWPELESQLTPIIETYAENFFEIATQNQFLVDGYNSDSGVKTETLLISYLDFQALAAIKTELDLEDKIAMDEIVRQGKALMQSCYISDEFPFYYQRFYLKGFLIEEESEINMIEAMLVVKHLAEVGEVEAPTLAWLRTQIEVGIFSTYTATGEIAKNEQSSAVYALVAQVAQLIEDEWLYEQAMAKIWQYQIQDQTSPLYGALGEITTQTVVAYDQLQTLIATINPKEKK